MFFFSKYHLQVVIYWNFTLIIFISHTISPPPHTHTISPTNPIKSFPLKLCGSLNSLDRWVTWWNNKFSPHLYSSWFTEQISRDLGKQNLTMSTVAELSVPLQELFGNDELDIWHSAVLSNNNNNTNKDKDNNFFNKYRSTVSACCLLFLNFDQKLTVTHYCGKEPTPTSLKYRRLDLTQVCTVYNHINVISV